MAINWEPSEFDKTFLVSGTLSDSDGIGRAGTGVSPVCIGLGERSTKRKSESTSNASVQREGLAEADISQDRLMVSTQSD